jgi:hypothetical protein
MLHDHSDDLLTPEEVVSQFPFLTTRHLGTLRQSGLLPHYRVRGRALFRRGDVESWLRSRRSIGSRSYRKSPS